jgi:hypothetical protein
MIPRGPHRRNISLFDGRRLMRQVRSLSLGEAAALVCTLHTGLNNEREQALAARAALEAIRAEATADAEPVETDSMTITELSQALGVKASALRFWEKAALLGESRPGVAGASRRPGGRSAPLPPSGHPRSPYHRSSACGWLPDPGGAGGHHGSSGTP